MLERCGIQDGISLEVGTLKQWRTRESWGGGGGDPEAGDFWGAGGGVHALEPLSPPLVCHCVHQRIITGADLHLDQSFH